MDNYIPVLTTKGRPLAPCHPQRARSLVRAGKAQFKHRYGIRCIVLTRTNVPKLRERCKLQLRIDPGARHTGITITRDDVDGSRTVELALVINHRGRTIKTAMTKRRQMRRADATGKLGTVNPASTTGRDPLDGCRPACCHGCKTP